MKIELKVPDVIVGADGREWEPIGEMRSPKPGEQYAHRVISGNWVSMQMGLWSGSVPAFPILRRKRWRAGYGETYYIIDGQGRIMPYKEDDSSMALNHYRIGNYFRTAEEAMIAGNRVLAAFKTEDNR